MIDYKTQSRIFNYAAGLLLIIPILTCSVAHAGATTTDNNEEVNKQVATTNVDSNYMSTTQQPRSSVDTETEMFNWDHTLPAEMNLKNKSIKI